MNIPQQYEVNDLPYAIWVYRVFTLTNPEDLDEYGPFDHIEEDAVDAYEQKALMFLNTVISNDDSREMFINTSSSLVAEEVELILEDWKISEYTHLEAYTKLLPILFEFLDGC